MLMFLAMFLQGFIPRAQAQQEIDVGTISIGERGVTVHPLRGKHVDGDGNFIARFRIVGWTRTGGMVFLRFPAPAINVNRAGLTPSVNPIPIPPGGVDLRGFTIKGKLINKMLNGEFQLTAIFVPGPGGGPIVSDTNTVEVVGWNNILSIMVQNWGVHAHRDPPGTHWRHRGVRARLRFLSYWTEIRDDKLTITFKVLATGCTGDFKNPNRTGANTTHTAFVPSTATYTPGAGDSYKIEISVKVMGEAFPTLTKTSDPYTF